MSDPREPDPVLYGCEKSNSIAATPCDRCVDPHKCELIAAEAPASQDSRQPQEGS